MATEAIGLAFGAVALIGVFENCVELLSQIGAAKSMEDDYALLETRLDFEKTLLLYWANRLRLLDRENYDRRLDNPTTRNLVLRALTHIQQLLEDGQALHRCYGIRPVGGDEPNTTPKAVSRRLQSWFHQKSTALKLQLFAENSQTDVNQSRYETATDSGKNGLSKFDKVVWVIRDKDQFELLVQNLSNLISKLDKLVSALRK